MATQLSGNLMFSPSLSRFPNRQTINPRRIGDHNRRYMFGGCSRHIRQTVRPRFSHEVANPRTRRSEKPQKGKHNSQTLAGLAEAEFGVRGVHWLTCLNIARSVLDRLWALFPFFPGAQNKASPGPSGRGSQRSKGSTSDPSQFWQILGHVSTFCGTTSGLFEQCVRDRTFMKHRFQTTCRRIAEPCHGTSAQKFDRSGGSTV